jgi:hypothetical protein
MQILENDVGQTRRDRVDIEHTSHVLASDLRGSAPLVQKASHGRFRFEQAFGWELDCDQLMEDFVLRREDYSHASSTEEPFDFVLSGNDVAYLRHAGCAGRSILETRLHQLRMLLVTN